MDDDMAETKMISVAYGDGIGPEIMESVLQILKYARARIEIETVEIGEKLYLKGNTNGISSGAWDSIKKNKILLKAPITTPQGKGYKSLNVTFRKTLGLFANVRPCRSYAPAIEALHNDMNMVIVRENEEDLYAGVEYKFTRNYTVSYKIITRMGSEKIIRYAFEYARANNRKKVTCLVKDNIMKITDGMFHELFDTIAKEYPEIENNVVIVDIGAARIASRPKDYDVVVTLNLYGDIVSDIAAEVSGSVGMAGSANIGTEYAMFEAVHGSAPDIAGKGIANPSGLLNGAIMMLEHIGQQDVALKIENALLKTLEDGFHPGDIYTEGKSKQKVGTAEFTKKIIENLGKAPVTMKATERKEGAKPITVDTKLYDSQTPKKLIGYDIFVDMSQKNLKDHIDLFENLNKNARLHVIRMRGLKIWPDNDVDVKCELISLRYIGYEDKGMSITILTELLNSLEKAGHDSVCINALYTYDDKIGFSLAQGE